MAKKINIPSREESEQIHKSIEQDYAEMILQSGGKDKMLIMERIAKKYGYKSGQAVRNVMSRRKKQQSDE